MNTTALIVEVLVVGIQFITVLLTICFVSIDGKITNIMNLGGGVLKDYANFASIFLIFLLATVYWIGVIVDKFAVIAACCVKRLLLLLFPEYWIRFRKNIRVKINSKIERAYSEVLINTGHGDVDIVRNHQSRLRVMRGTLLNSIILCVALAWVLIFQKDFPCFSTLLVSFSIILFAVITWSVHDITFEERVYQVCKIQSERKSQHS